MEEARFHPTGVLTRTPHPPSQSSLPRGFAGSYARKNEWFQMLHWGICLFTQENIWCTEQTCGLGWQNGDIWDLTTSTNNNHPLEVSVPIKWGLWTCHEGLSANWYPPWWPISISSMAYGDPVGFSHRENHGVPSSCAKVVYTSNKYGLSLIYLELIWLNGITSIVCQWPGKRRKGRQTACLAQIKSIIVNLGLDETRARIDGAPSDMFQNVSWFTFIPWNTLK